MNISKERVSVIGLGYVGLPLAAALCEKYETIGFDIDKKRISELNDNFDRTNEFTSKELSDLSNIIFTDDQTQLESSGIFIVTVPTPIDKSNQPDLRYLVSACEIVGEYLSNGSIVIFESTVYPHATEEICVPVLEEVSGLKYINHENKNEDGFYCGYSPERINPGDKKNPLKSIKKIVSGSTDEALNTVDELYSSIIEAGTVRSGSISSAEAAKVIENTQRDINIALVNEFALIFNKLNLDTQEILNLASTKWNFMAMSPGLVGGHCIGVDPYYLAYRAIESEYYPELILSGRKLNNKIGKHIGQEVLKLMTKKDIPLLNSQVLIMGFSFKENCPDIRNTRVIDIINHLGTYKCNIDVYDPLVNPGEVEREYGISLIDEPSKQKYDAIILAVSHDEFRDLEISTLRSFGHSKSIIYDVKYIFDKDEVDGRL